MRVSVRRAQHDDLPRILRIERQGFGEWAWDRNLFADYTRSCGDLFLVAEVNGAVMGYCIGCTRRGIGSIESIAVARSALGKGVADALMRSLLRRWRARGVGRVHLMVKEGNERAMAFYRRHGFRRVRKVTGYYEDGTAGLMFRLEMGG